MTEKQELPIQPFITMYQELTELQCRDAQHACLRETRALMQLAVQHEAIAAM
jgi:hypothetical protein